MLDKNKFPYKRHFLVTGAFGFVGTHLCKELISKGAKVTALDYIEHPRETYFGLEGLENRTTVLNADVRIIDQLEKLRDLQFDAVFHLAAQPISPLSNLYPDDTMETNVVGTANMGKILSRQNPRPVFIFASSACWYGASTVSPLTESDSFTEGEFKYSESKVMAEKEVLNIESFYDIPTVRCRFVNLYGPGDRHFSRIIPKTIRHLLSGERPSLVRNDGSTILDFMHVEDAISALVTSAEQAQSFRGEVFNFGIGGENPRSAFEMAKVISKLFDGKDRDPALLNPVKPRTTKKFLDSTKARMKLGWRPLRKLQEGLSKTIGWYRENINKIEHLDF